MPDTPTVRSGTLPLLVATTFLTHLGEQGVYAALAVHVVTSLDAGVGATGILQTIQTLPLIFLALPMGVLVDRRLRLSLLSRAEGVRTLAYAGLLLAGVLAASGAASAAAMLAGLLVVSSVSTSYAISLSAMLPGLVGRTRAGLAGANSRLELAKTCGYLAGPPSATALLKHLGLSATLAAATLVAALVVVLLRACDRLNGRPLEPAGSESTRSGDDTLVQPTTFAATSRASLSRQVLDYLLEGLRFARAHALLRDIFVAQALFSAGYFALMSAFVPHAVHRLGMDAVQVGLLLGVVGAGMFVGAAVAPRLIRRVPTSRLLRASAVTAWLAASVIASTQFLPHAALAGAGLMLFAAAPTIWVVSTTTLRQIIAPMTMQGRLSSISVMSLGFRAVGAAAGSLLGALAGTAPVLALAWVLISSYAILACASPALRAQRD